MTKKVKRRVKGFRDAGCVYGHRFSADGYAQLVGGNMQVIVT